MPNIIEQQDLLKGLPDARLAMLLQNPAGDIPPFLVAAEAQRRQAIRQQFAGSENNESVVDSLTKQLANVPQNIPAPTRTPPMVPPTPPMEGVAALQAQQAMAQMAQQPQAMRNGGMVKRYNEGGIGFRGRQGAGGYAPGEEPSGFGAIPKVFDYVSPSIEEFIENMRRYGTNMTPEDVQSAADRMKQLEPPDLSSVVAPPKPRLRPDEPSEVRPPMPKARPENLPVPAPGETEDEFRARLEALYAAQEPSDWEKAQKYFAMAEQFLDPSKTTMQSIAGAGQAFAQSVAEQARAQREAELSREKAMLEYDMGLAQQRAAAEKAERERTSLSASQQADILVKSAESIRRVIDSKRDQVTKLSEDPLTLKMDPSATARIAALQEEIAKDEARLMNIEGALASLGEQAYGPISFEPYSLRSGFVR